MTTAQVTVRVQPRSRHAGIDAMRHGVLVVRVNEPAIDGRANRAACRLIAKRLGVPASKVTILRGQTQRDKLIAVEGIDQAKLDAEIRR
jgi:uncharacterized protein